MCGRSASLTRLTSRLPLLPRITRAGLRPTRRPVGARPSHKHSAQNLKPLRKSSEALRYHGAMPPLLERSVWRSAVQRWKPHPSDCNGRMCGLLGSSSRATVGLPTSTRNGRQGTGSGAMAIRTSGLGRDGVGSMEGRCLLNDCRPPVWQCSSCQAFQMHSVASGAPKRRGPV